MTAAQPLHHQCPTNVRTSEGWGEFRLKTIFIGESGCGKTQILRKLLRRGMEAATLSTVKYDITNVQMELNLGDRPLRVNLEIWDTAGQEQYRHLVPQFYRNSVICLLVYDISNAESFEKLEHWLNSYVPVAESETDTAVSLGRPAAGIGPGGLRPNMAIVGTKADLNHLRQVPRRWGHDLAKNYDMAFAEITSLHNQGSGELERLLAFLVDQALRDMTCPPELYTQEGWLNHSLKNFRTSRPDEEIIFPIYRLHTIFKPNPAMVDYQNDDLPSTTRDTPWNRRIKLVDGGNDADSPLERFDRRRRRRRFKILDKSDCACA